ncbi:MAG TPA: benzoate-CoA ligase family protein, partial [Vicinamibacterales bacterium]|nr:benzoate-CoA ligase family protein [Vicinamibacterales bacterium]
MPCVTAGSLGIPDTFNVATHFVDRNVLEGRGSHVAIECADERVTPVTYDALLRNVNRFGLALRGPLGIRPEERVLLLLFDGPEFAYAFFGSIKAGAIPVPLNTLWKAQDYSHVLADSRASVLVVSEGLLPGIQRALAESRHDIRHIMIVGGDHASDFPGVTTVWRFDQIVGDQAIDLDAERCSRDAPAFWLYSSGSTGTPKGCVHLQHDMVICAELFGKGVLGIRPTDRCFSVAKLFFAYGLGNALYFPFSVGATTILWPGPPTPANVYSVIERHGPTLLFSVPTGYGMMLACSREGEGRDFDLSSLRLAVSAGEALPAALYDRFKSRFGVDILDGIGSTEALHMFISNAPGAIRAGSSGKLVAGYEARLLDDEGARVPRGEIGNLWIKGDSVCSGYWNQHEKTKNTIEGQWIRTGDKYSQDEDGFFWYAGRSDDMLKVGGLWVSPVE